MPSVPPAAIAPAESLGSYAALDHDRGGHDAEHRHRRPDDAGRHREHRGGQDHDQEQGAAHRREQIAEGEEQPLHQPRLLGHVAHEDEERHSSQHLLLHQADDLEIGEVEYAWPEPDETERESQKQEREGDRKADEDDAQQQDQHDQAEQLGSGHITGASVRSTGLPVRAA